MTQKLDHIVVIDTHSTCWKDDPPDGETSEIIEIGVCTVCLDSLEASERSSILVTPSRSKVSDHCADITTRCRRTT